ncbi:class I SAM-dependent methyltransferase [Actinomycetospora chiangmaiensis]|uniref:class I SAM-dependent methyltransferase n=1 Tax=Actinomycetospora chiangmaiensis TaxID=402650 RepID=UPI00037FA2C7|nr:class I SAM-dependent methyltransferase [Actinomycetospora chiangmaiensis]
MSDAHGHGHGHGHGHDDGHAGDMAEVLDLDADVFAEHLADLAAWLPVRDTPREIVDLGAGTGVGTFALLDRFPGAHVTALDSSAAHLRRLQEKADDAGLAGQVDVLPCDLDGAGVPLGTPDLVWASASLHHLADPEGMLRRLGTALAPGGLIVVVEIDGFPRFLPDDAPADRPGLEARAHVVADRLAAERMPHRGADFAPLIEAAGLRIEAQRTDTLTVDGSHSAAVGRYALAGLQRLRDGVADGLEPEDLGALDRLVDPDGPGSILRRDDLMVRTTRPVWAVRPTVRD